MKEYLWHIKPSGNSNRAWIIDSNLEKISKLMLEVKAMELINLHNETIVKIFQQKDGKV